jgi:serine/threonine protein kinase
VNQAQTLPGIGDIIDGRFRIDRKLGEGGTSTVYEVSHLITDKKFAIKWLLPELALEDAAVDRFVQEARVGGKFSHPNAAEVYDICRANGSFYMLMELLEGESLQSKLERVGRLSVHEACSIVLACAGVLRAAHQAGIVHRDLKPANIFLCTEPDGTEVPKVLDFGISTFCKDRHAISLTVTPRGSVIGTPLYMSPEQMLSQFVDARTDIYALGAVLYELVSGVPPYQADSYAELVVKVTVEARPTPLDRLADVDLQFVALVARAMARRPEDRFATVDELADALRSYVAAVEASSIRAISASAKVSSIERPWDGLLESLRKLDWQRPRRRTTVGVSPLAIWLAAFALGGVATAAVVGAAHVRQRDGRPVRMVVDGEQGSGVANAGTPVASPRPAAQLAEWEPHNSELLTGRATPSAMPDAELPTGRSLPKAKRDGAAARDG